MSFIAELKRRNVIRVAVFYLVAAWLTIQVADILLDVMAVPDWGMRLILIIVLLGFPAVVTFSWIFELTPDGLKREKDVDRSSSLSTDTGRKLDIATILVVAMVGVLVLWQKFEVNPTPPLPQPSPQPEPAPEPVAPDNSIAVLAFTNMSSDKEQEYFADGLSDTLIHVLAQVSGLKVAAKTSSFYFKGKDVKISQIAEELKVAHILEGSVQKAGNRIRVIAQLIKAADGSHLWSKNFDLDLEDVFAIQDEIATAVVSALKMSLLGESAEVLNRDQTDNVDAYTEYLLGINDLNVYTVESDASAIRHLQEAVRLDPDYALAHAMLGRVYINSTDYGGYMSGQPRDLRQPASRQTMRSIYPLDRQQPLRYWV